MTTAAAFAPEARFSRRPILLRRFGDRWSVEDLEGNVLLRVEASGGSASVFLAIFVGCVVGFGVIVAGLRLARSIGLAMGGFFVVLVVLAVVILRGARRTVVMRDAADDERILYRIEQDPGMTATVPV